MAQKKFIPPGQTVNAVYYVDVPEKLRKRVLGVRKEIAATGVFHHDNVPSHFNLYVREFLTNHILATLPQSPLINTALKGHRLEDNEAIQAAVMTTLNEVPLETFQAAYWENH